MCYKKISTSGDFYVFALLITACMPFSLLTTLTFIDEFIHKMKVQKYSEAVRKKIMS